LGCSLRDGAGASDACHARGRISSPPPTDNFLSWKCCMRTLVLNWAQIGQSTRRMTKTASLQAGPNAAGQQHCSEPRADTVLEEGHDLPLPRCHSQQRSQSLTARIPARTHRPVTNPRFPDHLPACTLGRHHTFRKMFYFWVEDFKASHACMRGLTSERRYRRVRKDCVCILMRN